MNIVIAVLLIGLLVAAHEFGHFLLAKTNGIGVVEYSIGMGPRLFSFSKGETRYSVKLIPFGGSCSMAGGLDEHAVTDEDEASLEQRFSPDRFFNAKSVWARISVVLAGPFFNFILAFLFSLIVLAGIGVNPAKVYHVQPGSSAGSAGIKEGDRIVSIDGEKIGMGRDIELLILKKDYSGKDSIPVEIERGGEILTVSVDPTRTAYMLGISYYADDEPAAVTISVGAAGDTAAGAGLKDGDVITMIGDTPIASGKELNEYFAAHPLTGEPVTLRFTHNGAERETVFTPVQRTVTEFGFEASYYREKAGFGAIVAGSFREVGYWIRYVLTALGKLVTGGLSARNLSGPVGIVKTVDDLVDGSSSGGFSAVLLTLLNFAIMLSANLGVMNLLPLPALDGGRLLFLLIEAVRGKPVPPEKEGLVHTVGMFLLIALMVYVLFNDIMRIL